MPAAASSQRSTRGRRRRSTRQLHAEVQTCHELLRDHGAACGAAAYPTAHQARWRARHNINTLVTLGYRSRGELRSHVEHEPGTGWHWHIELLTAPDLV